MKLYNRAAFMALPAGVLYFKGKEWYFEGLEIKEETCGPPGEANDWFCINPAWVDADSSFEAARLLERMMDGESGPMQETAGRDGLYEKDAIFLVLEAPDLLKLNEWVARALKIA